LGFELSGSTALTVLNIILSFALIRRIGFAGALWGTAIAALAGSLWFLVRYHRFLRLSIGRFLGRSVLGPVSAGVFVSVVLIAVPVSRPVSGGRAVLLAHLVVRAVVFGACYAFLVHRLRFVDAYEREVFANALRKLLGR